MVPFRLELQNLQKLTHLQVPPSSQSSFTHCAQNNFPTGMLATVTGLQGGAHNGLGKGFGGLLGGFTIEYTKSTHRAFWNFGLVAFLVGVIYSAYVLIMMIKRKVTGESSEPVAASKDPKKPEPEEEKFITAVPDLEKMLPGNGNNGNGAKTGNESKEMKDSLNNMEREARVNGAPKEAQIESPAL